MKKYPLIGVCICAVVLFVLSSLSNVIGYQTIQSSNQKILNDDIDQRELLFQTIVDIANNKEIQRIILKSQMSRGIFPTSDIPVLTKNQLRQIYILGMMLSRFISKSRIQSIFGKFQFNNQEIQQEINAVIEKNPTIEGEITQLQDSECACENNNTIQWNFPVLCVLLYPLLIVSVILLLLLHYYPFYNFMEALAKELNCFWAQP